jgi:hypothetical protein
VTYYEDAPEPVVSANKALGGPTSDVLCAAYSEGASLLAAGCYSGEVGGCHAEPLRSAAGPGAGRAAAAYALLEGALAGTAVTRPWCPRRCSCTT